MNLSRTSLLQRLLHRNENAALASLVRIQVKNSSDIYVTEETEKTGRCRSIFRPWAFLCCDVGGRREVEEEECIMWWSGSTKDRWGLEVAAWAYTPDILTGIPGDVGSKVLVFSPISSLLFEWIWESCSWFQVITILSDNSKLNLKSRDLFFIFL